MSLVPGDVVHAGTSPQTKQPQGQTQLLAGNGCWPETGWQRPPAFHCCPLTDLIELSLPLCRGYNQL